MPNYSFDSLSFLEFEQMSRDLLQLHLEKHFESFKVGADGGIDFRYKSGAEYIVVQCKHFPNSNGTKLKRVLVNEELPKIKKLPITRYIVASSAKLSNKEKEAIKTSLSPYCLDEADVLGADDINNLLGKYSEIETKNFKLWLTSQPVMSRILQNGIFAHSEVSRDDIFGKIQRFVQSRSYVDAMQIIRQHNVCVVSGIAGIGKSTLAEMMIASLIDNDYQYIKIQADLKEAFDVLDRNLKQVFYYDDFLGKTSFSEKSGDNREGRLVELIRYVNKSPKHKLILATREYILKQAVDRNDDIKFSDIELFKYVLELKAYSRVDKAKILYNHLYFGRVPGNIISHIIQNRRFGKIVDHRNYCPRTVEQMTRPMSFNDVSPEEYFNSFMQSLDNPLHIWDTIYRHQIAPISKYLLLVMATLPDAVVLEDLEAVLESFLGVSQLRFPTSRDRDSFASALRELENSFIKIDIGDEAEVASFHNPSIIDYIEGYIRQHRSVASDLFKSSTSFFQVDRLVQILNPSGVTSGSIDDWILESVYEACLRTQLFTSGNCISPRSLKIYRNLEFVSSKQSSPVEILHSFVNLAKRSQHPRRKAYAEDLFRTISGLTGFKVGKLNLALDMVRFMKIDLGMRPPEMGHLFTSIKSHGLNYSSTSQEFLAVLDLMQICPEGFSKDELNELEEFIVGEALPSIIDDIEDLEDIEDVEAVLELINRASSNFGYSLTSEESTVEKRLEELQEPPEPDDDDLEPEWDGPVSATADPDEIMNEMFDSLQRNPYDAD